MVTVFELIMVRHGRITGRKANCQAVEEREEVPGRRGMAEQDRRALLEERSTNRGASIDASSQQDHQRHQRDLEVMESLATSFKAFLVLVYLQADAVTGISGRSSRNVLDQAEQVIRTMVPPNMTTIPPDQFTYAQLMLSPIAFEQYLPVSKASAAGSTLNFFLLVPSFLIISLWSK